MELVAVAALLRTVELVSVDDVLGRKNILETIDSFERRNSLGNNRIMPCEEMLGWLFGVFRRF